MSKWFNKLLQHIAPQHALSRFAGWMANCRWVWLKNRLIRNFIRDYEVDMKAAILESPNDYPNFNAFFTRHLKPTLRPIVQLPHQIASPADGCISQIGKIYHDTLLQAKGFQFNLLALLGGSINNAALFYDGCFVTLYLSPRDYHRVHMPFSGTLRETTYIPGNLFSVSNETAQLIPNLFARNERLVCLFDTNKGPMIVILVGAMIVGSIHTVWSQTIHRRQVTIQSFADQPIYLEKGAELGHFELGSTVIVLFAKDKMEWGASLITNTSIQMGQLLGAFSE